VLPVPSGDVVEARRLSSLPPGYSEPAQGRVQTDLVRKRLPRALSRLSGETCSPEHEPGRIYDQPAKALGLRRSHSTRSASNWGMTYVRFAKRISKKIPAPIAPKSGPNPIAI